VRTKLLLVLAAVALVCLVGAVPAGAAPDSPLTTAQTGPPNGEGAWAYCNVAVNPVGVGGVSSLFTYSLACQYGPTTLSPHVIDWRWYTSAGSAQQNKCGYDSSGDAAKIVDVHPGRFTCVATETRTPPNPFATTIDTVTAGVHSGGCNLSEFSLQVGVSTTGSVTNDFLAPASGPQVPSEVPISCGVGNPPGYPSPFWSGGGGGNGSGFNESDPTDSNTDSGSGASCGAWWHIGCYVEKALTWFFVPDGDAISDAIAPLTDDISSRFPFTLLTPITDITTAIVDDVNASLDPANNGCYWEPLVNVDIPYPNDGGVPYNFDPMIPTGKSGCSYSAQNADLTDLWGFRDEFRLIVEILLWGFFFVRLVRAFGITDNGLAPIPDGEDTD